MTRGTQERWAIVGCVTAVGLTAVGLVAGRGGGARAEPAAHHRVVMIGVPGLSWPLVLDGIEAGRLPELARRVRGDAAVGDIIGSGYRTDSEVLASVVTGRFPLHHRIHDAPGLLRIAQDESPSRRPVWEWMMRRGGRVATIGFPFGTPSRSLGALVIPGERPRGRARLGADAGNGERIASAPGRDAGNGEHIASAPGRDAGNGEHIASAPGRDAGHGVRLDPALGRDAGHGVRLDPALGELALNPDDDVWSRVERVAAVAGLSAQASSVLRRCLAFDLTAARLARESLREDPGRHVFLYLDGMRRSTAGSGAKAATVDAYYGIIDGILADLAAASGEETTFILFSERGNPGGEVTWRPRFPRLDPWPPVGFFLAWGREVRRSVAPHALDPADVAATLLYLSGSPLPDDSDGAVLFGALDDGAYFDQRLAFRP